MTRIHSEGPGGVPVPVGSAVFVDFTTHDVRFPTSRELDGSDAMNPDPDYSAAYVVIGTDLADGRGGSLAGHGFAFTIGRGNDVQVAAIGLLASTLLGRRVADVLGDLGAFARELVDDSQLRWLGPEKGIMHMAIGAVVNALWDLRAKAAGQPLWLLLASLEPEEVVGLVDFRYLSDALTRDDALALLQAERPFREDRIASLIERGYPAYTTSPGWLGYPDEKLQRLSREAVADGFTQIKLKVGGNFADDERRLRLAREAVGPEVRIALDANQRWDVPEAITWVRGLSHFDPYWIEEPTSPDDVVGHAAIRRAVAPVRVATGEHGQNRILFKQLLQLGAVDVVQIDAARVGGVNENLAILLLAKKFGIPVCPHAGGVGLCELVQHLAMFDFVALTGSTEDRMIEYVDHLHEHFVTPVVLERGRYRAPSAPGGGGELRATSLAEFSYPGGPAWRS